jgi:hypothetical protein
LAANKIINALLLLKWVMAIEEYDRMVKGSGGTVEESK